MAIDIKTGASPTPQPLLPRCQYCGADPAPIAPVPLGMGAGQVTIFTCGNMECRAIHSVQLTHIIQEQPKVVAPGAGLVIPR